LAKPEMSTNTNFAYCFFKVKDQLTSLNFCLGG